MDNSCQSFMSLFVSFKKLKLLKCDAINNISYLTTHERNNISREFKKSIFLTKLFNFGLILAQVVKTINFSF